jgi:iron-sulfur cluster repair protein YtfE (RIC family)
MDIYQNLKKDHDEVKNLLKELLSLSENDDYRYILIETIATELIPHSKAEETIFYNTIRDMDANTGIVMHSYKEHKEAEALLHVLQTKDKINIEWKKTAQKLKDELEHHIHEEESKVFSLAKRIFSKEEAEQIGKGFIELKEEFKNKGVQINTAKILADLLPARFANKVHNLNL